MSWGVLAYIVADEVSNLDSPSDDSLDKAAQEDLQKLLKAASDTGVPIAAQIDYEGRPGIWRQVRAAGSAAEPVQVREANSNNPKVLREFLRWARPKVKAEHCLLMLWGHGNGPTGFFSDGPVTKGLPAQALSTARLTAAIREPQGEPTNEPLFDIVLLKACFAATLEVAYELAGRTPYVIASQDLIPSQTYWPYKSLFKHLKNAGTSGNGVRQTAENLLDVIGDVYKDEKNRPNKTEVPYSLLAPEGAVKAGDCLKTLVTKLREVNVDLTPPKTKDERPGDLALLDVALFCEFLQKSGGSLAEPAGKLRESLEALVLKQHPQPKSSRFRGVSLFHHPGYAGDSIVRENALYGLYKRSRLAADTGWADIAYQDTVISKLADTVHPRGATSHRRKQEDL